MTGHVDVGGSGNPRSRGGGKCFTRMFSGTLTGVRLLIATFLGPVAR